jgi:hypothetical protein
MDSLSQVVTWCFLVTNTARLFAYLPQIRAAWNCSNGAQSVSRATWGYFAAAHVTGAVYAVTVARDLYMAAMFSCNFSACIALLAVITWKRRQQRAPISARPAIGPAGRRLAAAVVNTGGRVT